MKRICKTGGFYARSDNLMDWRIDRKKEIIWHVQDRSEGDRINPGVLPNKLKMMHAETSDKRKTIEATQ